MSPKPTLIFIPGAWHTAAVWDKVTQLLKAQGHNCIALNLPSCSSDPSATFKDDIQAVHAAIISETTVKNHNVVLVAWSYGGHVANSAIKDLTSTLQTTNGNSNNNNNNDNDSRDSPTRVLGLALIASGFTATGISFLEATDGVPPPFITLNHTTGFADLSADPKALFYHDLPLAEARHWESRLTNMSLRSLTEGGEHAYAGWKDLPVWFLVTAGDRALPAGVQREFVKGAKGRGGDVTVREVEGAGHAVMLGKAWEVVGFLEEALEALEAFGG